MKVHGTIPVSFHIDRDQIDQITEQRIREVFDLVGYHIEGDDVVWWEDVGHGSGITHHVRKATLEDRFVLRIIESINAKK